VTHQQCELPVSRPLVFGARAAAVALPGVSEDDARRALGGGSVRVLAALGRAHRDAGRGLSARATKVRQVVVEVFGIPASKGAIDNAIMRMSAVLADLWAELRAAVQKAEVVHADEATWRLCGAQQWLWVAASALMACYRIDPSRSQAAAKELLGEDFGGFVVSDRYAGYHFLDVLQQQLCCVTSFGSWSRSPSARARRAAAAKRSSRSHGR
jgi:hypothetical protein